MPERRTGGKKKQVEVDLDRVLVLTTGQLCGMLQCDRAFIDEECRRFVASKGKMGLPFFQVKIGGRKRWFRLEAVKLWMERKERTVWD